MTSRIALALCLLLALSGLSFASGPSESGSEAAEDAGATDGPATPSAQSSESQDTGGTPAETESDQDAAPIDVHRHRPGACPEGPPCKGDDE